MLNNKYNFALTYCALQKNCKGRETYSEQIKVKMIAGAKSAKMLNFHYLQSILF